MALFFFLGAACASPAQTPCTSSRQCASGGLVCDRSIGRCVECAADIDCLGAGEICLAHACVTPATCVSSRECPGQVCDPDRAYCVDCVTDRDCVVGLACEETLCVPERRDPGIPPSADGGPTPSPTADAGPMPDSGPMPRTIDDGGPRTDAGRPLPPTAFDAGADAGSDPGPPPVDAGPPPVDAGPVIATCDPSPATIHITELMVLTALGEGDRGEWFELFNSGSCDVNLAGLAIESPTNGGSLREVVLTEGVLRAGEYAVFAQSHVAYDNHGLAFDFAYGMGNSGVVLSNPRDTLRVSYGGVALSTVHWTEGTPLGVALQRDPADRSDEASILAAPFCEATAHYGVTSGGDALYGSPGAPNPSCP